MESEISWMHVNHTIRMRKSLGTHFINARAASCQLRVSGMHDVFSVIIQFMRMLPEYHSRKMHSHIYKRQVWHVKKQCGKDKIIFSNL